MKEYIDRCRTILHNYEGFLYGVLEMTGHPIAYFVLQDEHRCWLASTTIQFHDPVTLYSVAAFTYHLNNTYYDKLVWVDYTPNTKYEYNLFVECGWRKDDERVILDIEKRIDTVVPRSVDGLDLDMNIVCDKEPPEHTEYPHHWVSVTVPQSVVLMIKKFAKKYFFWTTTVRLAGQGQGQSQVEAVVTGINFYAETFYVLHASFNSERWDKHSAYVIYDNIERAFTQEFAQSGKARLSIWHESFIQDFHLVTLQKWKHYPGYRICSFMENGRLHTFEP